MRLLLIGALVALCAAACGTPSQVAFDTGGLKYESGGVGIEFQVPAKREFIDGKWRIDNWEYKTWQVSSTRGGEVSSEAVSMFVRKDGKPFEGTLRVDMDNDGREEDYSAVFTDLELRHAETDGRIWVLMRELPAHRAQVKLDVLIDEYAERLSFEEYTRVGPFDVWLLPTKKYAARVISKESVKLGTLDAVVATIEIANLAQLQLDPQSRMGFVRVLMVRVPGFESNVIKKRAFAPFERSNTGLLVVGYYDSTAYFEKGLADFEAFLGQFTVNGKPVTVERTAPPADPALRPPAPSEPPASTESTPSTESTLSTPPTGAP
ncbi:MAG: hypothetical protein M0R80_06765 [Proteobacteria bacterium]|nr:hypothetical protein [Pseudomonadota bacterium]